MTEFNTENLTFRLVGFFLALPVVLLAIAPVIRTAGLASGL
jgi:hypothetical protein